MEQLNGEYLFKLFSLGFASGFGLGILGWFGGWCLAQVFNIFKALSK